MSLIPQPIEVVFAQTNPWAGLATVTVAITCYKYGNVGLEALNSLVDQTEPVINVVLIDDQSPDDSVAKLLPWFEANAHLPKFGEVKLIRHIENQGLSKARNTLIAGVDTSYVFILDADNKIYPRALEQLRIAIEASGCAMAYSLVEVFGGKGDLVDNSVWVPEKFSKGNYVDAMALIRTDVVKSLGGYRVMPNKFGWEDFDFWCKLVDHGLVGCHVPQILCRYRSHPASMVNTETYDFLVNKLSLVKADFEKHHSFKFNFTV